MRNKEHNSAPAENTAPAENADSITSDNEPISRQMKFQKYKLEVTAEFQGNAHIGWHGRFVETLKRPGQTSIAKCPQEQADRINVSWPHSLIYLHPVGEPMPMIVSATKQADGSFTSEVKM